jgi:UDP-hydrolysing UDP-N-acetyl-D-glucosamine 2-epimerase
MTAILSHPDLTLQVVVAASALLERYGQVETQIRADGFPIDARVRMVLEGEDTTAMAKTTGLGIIELTTVFERLQPDVVVTVADRYETLATAVAASFMGIPLAHIQGGEVTGSIDERVRHSVTKLSDLHFPATARSRDFIIRMGESPESVVLVGCPSVDLAVDVKDTPELSFDPFKLYGGVGPELDLTDGFMVVMLHPVTTEHELARYQVESCLEAVRRSGRTALWFWPNVDAGADGTSKGIRAFREKQSKLPVHFFKNLAPHHFLELLKHSRLILGNSSVAIRECSFLGVPAINIGSRQNGRERGRNVIDVDFDISQITGAIDKLWSEERFESDHTYGDGSAGLRIADALATHSFSREKRLTYLP